MPPRGLQPTVAVARSPQQATPPFGYCISEPTRVQLRHQLRLSHGRQKSDAMLSTLVACRWLCWLLGCASSDTAEISDHRRGTGPFSTGYGLTPAVALCATAV